MSRPSFHCFSSFLALLASVAVNADEPLVFISAFKGGDDGAIHAFRLNTATGELKQVHQNKAPENPYFLAVAPSQKYLYAIDTKSFGGETNEDIAAYRVNGDTGELTFINKQSAQGAASCYLDVDAGGKALVVANYTSGSVASYPINADGSIGASASLLQHVGSSVNPNRQKEPHAHCFVIGPKNRFVFSADLGIDQVVSYALDAKTAKLSPSHQRFVRTPPGAGPRHLTFHPNGKQMYVINELTNSVTHYAFDAQSGTLIERGTISTLPADFDGTSYCADVKVTPNGRFLYGTNRGHDSLAAYKIADDGSLTLIKIYDSLGKGPQNLAIAADGALLICANMPGNNVVVFKIDKTAGTLQPIGKPIAMPMPSCIMVLE